MTGPESVGRAAPEPVPGEPALAPAPPETGRDVTEPFTAAVAEAERLVEAAPFVRTEQDLLEGYDYLAGSIRASLQMAWSYDRDLPSFVNSTNQHTKMGLDNPDTVYYHANIADDAEYVVTGRRGTTADLSFQVMNGDYSPASSPDSLSAFDDREIDVRPDGSFELRFGPPRDDPPTGYLTLGPGAAMLIVREVYSDWDSEERGQIQIQRVDSAGRAPAPLTHDRLAKRYAVAGKLLLGRIRTWFAFPEWFYLNEPVNTLTEPRLTPGGLASQYSSVGHFDLAPEQAMVVTVPASGMPYQGIQLGSPWYTSLDYINHQTSLTADQAHVDPDGMIRFVVSERDPGVVNWLELVGHRRGYLQLRWQRVTRELTAADGPSAQVVRFDQVRDALPFVVTVTPDEHTARVAARQRAVARRMLG